VIVNSGEMDVEQKLEPLSEVEESGRYETTMGCCCNVET
jgi:hypothetical protein